MTSPLAVNPQALTLLNRAAFLTVGEYKAAPTAVAVGDLNIHATDSTGRDSALARLIERASSLADARVFPGTRGGTLAASLNTETGYINGRRDGSFVLPCSYKPVLALQSLEVGASPSLLAVVSSGVDVSFSSEAPMIIVDSGWATGASLGLGAVGGGGRIYAQWTYVNGYPHTTLAGSATAGAQELSLRSTLGIFPGTWLGIYDGDGNDENAMVVGVDANAGSVEIDSQLLYDHTVPDAPNAVGVSALPSVAKEATILLVSGLAKARGSEALVMASINSPDTQMQSEYKDAVDDIRQAYAMLDRFAVVR